MDVHKNARTTPHSRMLMVERVRSGWSVASVASAHGVDPRTVRKWWARHANEGEAGLRDRSSRPHRSPQRLSAALEAEIAGLRRGRLSGPAIARRLGLPISTVGGVLRRCGLGRLTALEPRQPVVRYERDRPGELIHIDTKKLGRIQGVGHRIHGDRRQRQRGLGWEYLHVAIDDHSRLAYTELLSAENGEACAAFLRRAGAWFAQLGIAVELVMTDNAFAYTNSRAFKAECRALNARHITTRPYRPRTNGKAERFIQTALREWLYARPYEASQQRAADMPAWLCNYNLTRPHAGIGGRPPITRLAKDNLLGNDT